MPDPMTLLSGLPHVMEKIFVKYLDNYTDFAACMGVSDTWRAALLEYDSSPRFKSKALMEQRLVHSWFKSDPEITSLVPELRDTSWVAGDLGPRLYFACGGKFLIVFKR